jgi:dihydrofolate reductase
MRKIIVTEFMTVDGVIEDPGGSENFEHGGWTQPYGSEEIEKFKLEELSSSDALLLGKTTYEGFAKVWPSLNDNAGFAARMNQYPKYVISETLDVVTWNNSHVLKDSVAIDEIKKIKQSEGKNILVYGSGEMVRSLMPLSLIDEFRLLVYPLVLGSGKSLFGDHIYARLNFVECKNFPKGVTLLRYDLNLKE